MSLPSNSTQLNSFDTLMKCSTTYKVPGLYQTDFTPLELVILFECLEVRFYNYNT
jgi:hypothetical protein